MDVRLAAVIMHDIKNALGVLEGELQRMTIAPEREQALSAHAHCGALRERLIGFLTLYKASSQGLNAHVEALAPQDFLAALLAQRLGGRPDITISIDQHRMPALAFFDENLVGLALEAALQNATRFARSMIEIGCSADEDGGVCFTVRDDGPGLGTKEASPSTGLGMELCKVIAHAHRKGDRHGRALLLDHAAGGAAFQLYLP